MYQRLLLILACSTAPLAAADVLVRLAPDAGARIIARLHATTPP